MLKEPIPQLARRSLQADALLRGMLRHIIAVAEKLQAVRASQISHELLIRIRLRRAQLVIEVNN